MGERKLKTTRVLLTDEDAERFMRPPTCRMTYPASSRCGLG
jgi:hypothetical protein